MLGLLSRLLLFVLLVLVARTVIRGLIGIFSRRPRKQVGGAPWTMPEEHTQKRFDYSDEDVEDADFTEIKSDRE